MPGVPENPGGRCQGAPGETRGGEGGEGGLPGNLAKTLRVPAGLRRAGRGTGRN